MTTFYPPSKKPDIHIEQDAIDEFEEALDEVLSRVLGLEPDKVLLTDHSQLSDFSGTGLPAEQAKACATLAELYDAWDLWVVQRLVAEFELDASLLSPRMRMLDLAMLIEAGRNRTTH